MSDIGAKIGQQIVREVLGRSLATEALAQGLSPILEAALGAMINGLGYEDTEKSWALFLAASLRFTEVGSNTTGLGTLGGKVGPDLSGLPEGLAPAIGSFAHLLGQPLSSLLSLEPDEEETGARAPGAAADDLRAVIASVLNYAATQSDPSIEAAVDEFVKLFQKLRAASQEDSRNIAGLHSAADRGRIAHNC